MRRDKRFLAAIGFALLGGLVLLGCSDDDGAVAPDVVISGDHAVEIGATLQLSASTVNGEDSSYTWQSDDESVATVDASGTVTGVAAGETYVTATGADTAVTGMHAVVVTAPAVGIPVVTVSGPLYVLVGSTAMFTPMTVNGTDSGYTWESSDEAVATVDATGNVTGMSVGAVTITATGADTMAAGSVQVAVSVTIPNEEAWAESGHADITAEAFRHWDGDGEVSASCARCHSTAGYRDYLGADGSAQFSVEQAAPIDGGGIECQACHNSAASTLSTVIFPSGVQVDDLGPEARCMTCHQGRASTDTVNDAITAEGVADDTVGTGLGFINIHYYAAGATLNAGKVRGGYQYAGKTYDWRFRHVPGYDTCVGCHDPHSLEVKVSECQACHTGVTVVDDFKNIRMMSSVGNDYDGDGDTSESLHSELEGLRAKLMAGLQAYAAEMGNSDLCYTSASYPYFFIDTDGNGTCETSEATFSNGYAEWTPRLLRAAYNYQVSLKDPGAHAHNAKYIIQLMFDSIEDLNSVIAAGNQINIANARREDHGHFNGAGEPARHWDTDEAVSADCSKCHGGSEGFRFFLQYGVGAQELEQANGLDCATCHDNFGTTYDVAAVDSVVFPGGVEVENLGSSGLCSTCHSGRESGITIDAKIAENSLGFRNVHYLPAGAIKLGTQSKIGYEYPAKTYSGPWTTHPGGNNCTSCHNPVATNHTFQVADNYSACSGCHAGTTMPSEIRLSSGHLNVDVDGDGDSGEPLAGELSTLAEDLLAAIQADAVSRGFPICYDAHSYPYWFIDTDSSGGVCSASEASFSNSYAAASWTATLMKAAHNYQISQKEPGAWAHNFNYVAQLLIDSIEDIGGNVGTYVRPAP
ncbi:MAG: Ig-like domain-containing protein [bacterium]